MKCQNYKDFVVKNVSLRRYSSFDGLAELYMHHFELCMRAEKVQEQMMLLHSQTH